MSASRSDRGSRVNRAVGEVEAKRPSTSRDDSMSSESAPSDRGLSDGGSAVTEPFGTESSETESSETESFETDSFETESFEAESIEAEQDALLTIPQFQIDPPSERRRRDSRPLRQGALRDLLDAEFQRCHRFDTFNSIVGDLRTLLRRAVVREEENEEAIDFSRPRSSEERSLDLGSS